MQITQLVATLALLVAAVAPGSHALPKLAAREPVSVQDKYIVTLKPDADIRVFTQELLAVVGSENSRDPTFNGGLSVVSAIGYKYDMGPDFKGYSGTFSKGVINRLLANPSVAAIEPDAIVYAAASQSPAGSWGLTRVGQRDLDLSAGYTYPDSAGEGVTNYVLDTGVMVSHPGFEGRARFGYKAVRTWADGDVNGHGTHVAGTIASKTHGVAPKSMVVSVKVLGDDGVGTNAALIAGINWVAGQAKAAGKTSVANLSLAGGKSLAVNAAVKALVASGVVTVVPAGNSNQDACRQSPSSEPSAVTVASSANTDALSPFSNYGSKCVDIIAPGSAITSLWNKGGTNTISGTSMAAAHVAGAASLVLGANPALSVANVVAQLINNATPNKITLNKTSPNKLVYVN
ncbi:hypothetical protein H9P43_002768 [Blastocladiella emersonii ATCC 22665]|nr:hypothetical protein H9P43_002768 [Blastocladiella emersonii ATCC 22665]